ncbi:unnamed protein product [Peniophora sp. CBMAI 1063]|nr:unnamed protein product [Peniophora sp. CBMAI 1063]
MSLALNKYHYADTPVHTHPACAYCLRASRVMGLDDSIHLQRCGRCQVLQYCSRTCQIQAWKDHKEDCKRWQYIRNEAFRLTGDPNAWLNFVRWHEHHRDNITNAALACCIAEGPGSEKEHVYTVALVYKSDSSTPLEQKFYSVGGSFADEDACVKGTPFVPRLATLKYILDTREAAARRLQVREGTQRTVRMGVYLLVLHFDRAAGPSDLQFQSSFPITETQIHAKLNDYMHPSDILHERLKKGWKYRFCCGKDSEMSVCCCGGNAHEPEEELFPLDSLDDQDKKTLEEWGYLKPASIRGEGEGLAKLQDTPKAKKLRKKKRKVESNTEHGIGYPDRTSPQALSPTSDVSLVTTTDPRADQPAVEDQDHQLTAAATGDSRAIADNAIHKAEDVRYNEQVDLLQELFPQRSYEDLHSVLMETTGDIEHAALRLGEDTVDQWTAIQSKKARRKERRRSRATPMMHTKSGAVDERSTSVLPRNMRNKTPVSYQTTLVPTNLEKPVGLGDTPYEPDPTSSTSAMPTKTPMTPQAKLGLTLPVQQSKPIDAPAAVVEQTLVPAHHALEKPESRPSPSAAQKHSILFKNQAVVVPEGLRAPARLERTEISFGSLSSVYTSQDSSQAAPDSLQATTAGSRLATPPVSPEHAEPVLSTAHSDLDSRLSRPRSQLRVTHSDESVPPHSFPPPQYKVPRQQHHSAGPLHPPFAPVVSSPSSLAIPGADGSFFYLNPLGYGPRGDTMNPHPYNNPYEAHFTPHGTMPNMVPTYPIHPAPAQPAYYVQPPAMPPPPSRPPPMVDFHSARALKDATRELRDATQALRWITQDYHRVSAMLDTQVMPPGSPVSVSDQVEVARSDSAELQGIQSPDSTSAEPRGRQRRASASDVKDKMPRMRERAHSLA